MISYGLLPEEETKRPHPDSLPKQACSLADGSSWWSAYLPSRLADNKEITALHGSVKPGAYTYFMKNCSVDLSDEKSGTLPIVCVCVYKTYGAYVVQSCL